MNTSVFDRNYNKIRDILMQNREWALKISLWQKELLPSLYVWTNIIHNQVPSSNFKKSKHLSLIFKLGLLVTCFIVVTMSTYAHQSWRASLWWFCIHLHIKVLDLLVFSASGHGVLLAEALHFFRNLIPVLIVSLNVIGVVNDNLVSLAIIGRISLGVIAWKPFVLNIMGWFQH